MSGDLVIQLAQEALMVVLLVSAPMLGLGLIVGLLVPGDDINSGADACVHPEDHRRVCRYFDLWTVDAAHYGGVCDKCLCQPPPVFAIRGAAYGFV